MTVDVSHNFAAHPPSVRLNQDHSVTKSLKTVTLPGAVLTSGTMQWSSTFKLVHATMLAMIDTNLRLITYKHRQGTGRWHQGDDQVEESDALVSRRPGGRQG